MIEKDLALSRKLVMEFNKINSEPLAELYLLNGLFEVYHKKTIDQESNVQILKEIKESGLTTENKNIASNILKNLQKFQKNQLAPKFQLSNSENKIVELASFKGKYIYLNFWADWSIPSLRELKVIELLHEKYGDKLHFISINLDENEATFKSVQNKNNYNWTFLHIGNNYELKENYGVKTVPSYFLIDKKGKILDAFAPNPAEIEKRLFELSKQ
jgi:thiol-disulfide isomerase/thioredoxin